MRYTISLAIASLASLASPMLADVPVVVTDIPPVHALVAQVMGDLGAPVLLLENGANEHDVQLRPSQVQALAEARLVVWIGPELTPWLERALDATSGSDRLGLLALPGTQRRNYPTDAAPDPDGTDPHTDPHSSTDPHAWLDPDNALVWLDAIAADLSRLDPEHAPTYAANAATAKAGVTALDSQIAARLFPVRDRPFLTFHDAYGYYAAQYGLAYAGSVALGDASSPGAARLSALAATVEAGGAVCVFPEAQHDPDLITLLADSGKTRIGAAIDPSGTSLDFGPGAYAALMTGLADALADCLGR